MISRGLARRRRVFAAAVGALIALTAGVLVATPANAVASTGTGGQFVPLQTHLYSSVTANSKLAANTWRTIPIAGVAGVPSDGSVSSVQLTFTTFNQAAAGKLFADKTGVSSPNTTLPYQTYTNAAMTNSAVLALGSDGNIQVDPTTATDLIVDITGYFTSGNTAPGGFVPLDPTTRSGAPNGPVNANLTATQSTTFTVTGGSVPANASAVVLDVIAYPSDTTANGWAQVQPYGNDGLNGRAQLNWPAGQNYAWTTIVALPASANGQVTLSMGPRGSVRFQVGIEGYFTAGSSATNTVFTPGLTSVLDTRSPSSPLAANGVVKTAQVAGVGGVPSMASGITAVAVNLEIFPGTANGHIQISSDAMAGGTSLDQSYVANQPTSVFVVVKLGSDGGVNLQNTSTTAANVKIDIEGWYTNPAIPTTNCPSPYADGSTTVAIPSSPISCTVTASSASSSGETLQIAVDGAAQQLLMSETTSTTTSVSVPNTGGPHIVDLRTVDSAGNILASSAYSFFLGGAWENEALLPSTASGAEQYDQGLLDIAPAGDAFPAGVTKTFTITSSPDGSSGTVWSSASSTDAAQIPAGTLVDGQTYYWYASAVGPTTDSTATINRTSQIWSFIATSDAVDSACASALYNLAQSQGATPGASDYYNQCVPDSSKGTTPSPTASGVTTDEAPQPSSGSGDMTATPALSAVHSRVESTSIWGGSYYEVQSVKAYWDGSRAWSKNTYRGYTGYHSCHASGSWTIGAVITVKACGIYQSGSQNYAYETYTFNLGYKGAAISATHSFHIHTKADGSWSAGYGITG